MYKDWARISSLLLRPLRFLGHVPSVRSHCPPFFAHLILAMDALAPTSAPARPKNRRRQCLCGTWFRVIPDRDRYCSKPCALADSWNTLVAGKSHYRQEMKAREAVRTVSAKRVASTKRVPPPPVTPAMIYPIPPYNGYPTHVQLHAVTAPVSTPYVRQDNPGHFHTGARQLRRVPSMMHLASLARAHPAHPTNALFPSSQRAGY